MAQIDFALDVDDAAATRIDRSGNTRRHTKRRIANLQNRQAVALADRRAVGIDEDHTRHHVIENPRRNPPGTRGLGLERTFDVPGVGLVIIGQLADEVCFADQLKQVPDARRQTALMLGQSGAVGRQPCHRVGGQRRHALLRGAGFQQLRELLQRLVDHRDFFVEIDQHPKHLLKVRIQVLQGVIQRTGANDDDLDVPRDHLRSQRHGCHAAQFAQRRFHFQLARLQGALERVPDKRLAEHLFRFQNQEAAIGTVQRAGAQLSVGGV
ncbi:hypothetical protein ALP75_200956 [Pseudomonas syringae pv. actinidiae]|nr:hypothetical protein ALP75_200956 [Pseudomonas syringae pv. actinidiae]